VIDAAGEPAQPRAMRANSACAAPLEATEENAPTRRPALEDIGHQKWNGTDAQLEADARQE